MLTVQLRWWPSTQILTCYENISLSDFFIFLFFTQLRMNVKLGAWQQLEKYAGRRRPRINYGLRLLLFFFNLRQRVCLASLCTTSVLFLTQCCFPPHRSPSPCCHRQEGSEDKRRAETPGPTGAHTAHQENRKIQINLHKASHLTVCLQPPAEALGFSYVQSSDRVEVTSNCGVPAPFVTSHTVELWTFFAKQKKHFLLEILGTD